MKATPLQADYSFLDLAGWRVSARALFSEPGFVALDIDEVRNRIVIGIEDLADSKSLKLKLSDLGVPLEAILFEEMVSPTPSLALDDEVTPRVGAIRLGPPGGYLCTLGFNAHHLAHYGGRGFVTNSHCSRFPFENETSGVFRQPNSGAAIGQEHIDREPFFGAAAGCNFSMGCRYSDSVFVRYRSSASSERKIAVTDRAMIGGPANREIHRYMPVDGKYYPLLGRRIHKIGSVSDHSDGNVLSTCVDIIFDDNGITVALLCQGRAEYYSEGGDSGAPVFEIASNGLAIIGLHWARDSRNDNIGFYSPIDGILRDLGNMDYSYY